MTTALLSHAMSARCCARSARPGSRPTVRGLVAFGTRHTLSSQTDPQRGIGAARDWLFERSQAVAATSGGRMTVEKQSFVQQPSSPRSPWPP